MESSGELVPVLPRRERPWWWEWEAAALGLIVLAIYFTRLTAIPVCGEESRWATAAREMIATGDWVVPRQQATIFPERPPLTSWAMALVGLARGQVDLVAIRLPSALAVLLLTWLIYAYCRVWMSRLGSFASATIFATSAQLLSLGRLGESEAVFTLFVAGALLIWHAGYMSGWSRALTWTAGYSLAALGALTKGPQAPVYFAASCCMFLLWRREWRWLLSWGHALGIAAFVVIVGAWLVPFSLSNWQELDEIWTGLAQDRFTTRGLGKHLLSYPLETFGCLLPWSPLLFFWIKPSIRRALVKDRPQFTFLLIAVAVTYPSVWFAAVARGRYFMPLYPALAVLMGLVIEHCANQTATWTDRVAWRRFQRVLAVVAIASAVALVTITLLPGEQWDHARQSTLFLMAWCAMAVSVATALVWASLAERSPRPQIALLALASIVGAAYAGAMLNTRVHAANDLQESVTQLKQRLPAAKDLVSLGRVYHRFAYCYGTQISQVAWPTRPEDVPQDLDYFCFDRRPGDSEAGRSTSDGRLSVVVPGTLPFAWDVIAEVPSDPVKRRGQHDLTVVIGRRRVTKEVASLPKSPLEGATLPNAASATATRSETADLIPSDVEGESASSPSLPESDATTPPARH